MRKNTVNSFKGKVIYGNQLGRKIGFPTANLDIHLIQADLLKGVYGVRVTYNQKSFLGIMNVGVKPTIQQDNTQVHYEVHIFDFEEMIYGKWIEVEVCFFVREEMVFASLEELVRKIKMDVEFVKREMGSFFDDSLSDGGSGMTTETDLHLPDLAFIRFCESQYGINRGVYNTIDLWFYEQGLKDIIVRRKTILTFLDGTTHQPYGHGGLSLKLQEYRRVNMQ